MNVVIDTNVLVSAALCDRDPETVILFVLAPSFNSLSIWDTNSKLNEHYGRSTLEV